MYKLIVAFSLAAIVASSSGGFAGAIVLYETALGVGIAAGPLVGGLLGTIAWRGPFFGVAFLMAVALVATVVLLPATPRPTQHSSIAAPRLQARFGTARTLYANFGLLAIDLAVIATFATDRAVVIVAVIVAGMFLGINNTLFTQAVMMVAPVERPAAR